MVMMNALLLQLPIRENLSRLEESKAW